MVKEVKKEGKKFYVCERTGYTYTTKKSAQDCEKWATKHKKPNSKITSKSIESKVIAHLCTNRHCS